MEHDHHHHHHSHHSHHEHQHERQGNIKVAFFLNLTFAVLEIFGGIWTNSMVILSDALHDFGDSFSLGLAWFLQKYSARGSDQKYSYGYARFSLAGAFLNSLILIGGSVFILMQTLPRIFRPEEVDPGGMLIFAILGILFNGLAVLRLKKGRSLNERVVTWHLLEDVLGWVVVLLASVVLLFVDLPLIDPILSLIVTSYILYNVFVNLKETLNIFLQGVPKDISIGDIEEEISHIPGIKGAYHTHVWSLDGERNLLGTHIIVEDDITREGIIEAKGQVRELLREKGIDHVTIEVDFKSEEYEY